MPIHDHKVRVDMSSIQNRYPALHVGYQDSFVCLAVKFISMTILLNDKTVILLKLAEYRQILASSAYGLVAFVSGDIPRDFSGYLKNC